VGHRAGLDGRKISPTTGIRSRTVQLIAQLLYRLSYPAHIYIYMDIHRQKYKEDIYIYIYIYICVCVQLTTKISKNVNITGVQQKTICTFYSQMYALNTIYRQTDRQTDRQTESVGRNVGRVEGKNFVRYNIM